MMHCNNCGGFQSCGGCDRSLLLTEEEITLLRHFAQIPFLPVARKADEEIPVYLEEGAPENYALVLLCLEQKGLIDIDYHQSLTGFDYSAYAHYPLHGSMALTQRGQEVLDSMDLQGLTEA